ncbi:MAG: IS200/IS605 family transposase [Candidatus Marinimicrobia bacterium]|nr:IS200/IS605 family transposase [Candidatus Neomarinimicrobiota bacterium]
MSRFKKLSHSVWDCKYHVVWCPKYRFRVMEGQARSYIRDVLRELCRRHKVEILEGNVQPDHIHMVLSIPPSYSVSRVMGFLKGKSAIQIFRKFKNLRKKYYGQHYWSRGYCVSTIGLDEETIRNYVRWQQDKDRDENVDQEELSL